MQTINDYVKREFGEKLYKLAISGDFTCPNRDGKCGVGGCIFCSEDGSGDFAERGMSVTEQIEKAKEINGNIISLGKRILRTETAAITAVSMCMLYSETELE